jgi:hypothetical protein
MRKVIGILMCAAFVAALVVSQNAAAQEAASAHKYVGAAKCGPCHTAKTTGAQFPLWKETAHAKAYTTLSTDKAKEVFAKAVPGATGSPAESEKCLECHVTAFGAKPEQLAETFDKTEGVGCEVCHGPGSDYMKMSVMKDQAQSIAAGLIIPNEATCKKCHNEKSPTYKPFDYATYWAKIAHPKPEPAAK